ncbi:Early nodulin-like protein 1 [Linum perenne]
MAIIVSGSKVGRTMAIGVLGLSCLILLSLQKVSAFQFTVGGAKGWTVPDNSSTLNYNTWAEHSRFSVGDSIVFVYDQAHDSVLEVSKADYDSCTTSSPVGTYTDGHTVFTFNHSGAHYFISGNKDHCLKNQKVVIVVLADRSNHGTPAYPPSPTPPSPAPATDYSPPAVELTPATPPEGYTPHNAASSLMAVAGVIGSVGAFLASSLVLTF